MTLEQLKETVDRLSVADRAALAEYLLESISPMNSQVRAEWLALAEQRMAEVRAGRVTGVPVEEVLGSPLER